MAKQIGTSTLIDTWAATGGISEPTLAKKNTGWLGGEEPPHENMNFIQNEFGQKINHIMKNGIPEWDTQTEYETGDRVKYQTQVFRALADNTSQAPLPANANWGIDATQAIAGSDAITVTQNSQTGEDTIDVSGSGLVTADKFQNSDRIKWTESTGKAQASFQNPAPVEIASTNYTVSASQNGFTILGEAPIANTDGVITLPPASSLPPAWSINVITSSIALTSKVTIKAQGSDTLIRSGLTYPDGFNITATGCHITITNVTSLVGGGGEFIISGAIPNIYSAVCPVVDILNPSSTQSVNVLLTEFANDNTRCKLNFSIDLGLVGDSSWGSSGGTLARAFRIDYGTINTLANKYTTDAYAKEAVATPVVQNLNFESGRLYSTLTTGVSGISTDSSQINTMEIAVQTPNTARKLDAFSLNVELEFQNWIERN